MPHNNTFVLGAMRQQPGLMGSCPDVLDWGGSEVEIDGITPASQQVLPGYMMSTAGNARSIQLS